MKNALLIVEFILAVLIIVMVLVQPSKQDGLKGFIGGTQDTFFSRNKGRTKESLYARLTVVFAVLFALNTIALKMIK